MDVLDVRSLMGTELTKDGPVITAVYAATNERILVVGTSTGTLLSLDADNDSMSSVSKVLFCRTLHNGPILDIDLSTTSMLATSGYDATCVVLPLTAAVGDFAMTRFATTPPQQPFAQPTGTKRRRIEKHALSCSKPRRLTCHTLPVVAVRYFSDGYTLATLSVRGQLTVVNATTGSRLCEVQCGFAVRALALSPDEAYCYVGGTHLARVDISAGRRAHTSAAPSIPSLSHNRCDENACQPARRDSRVQLYMWRDAQHDPTPRTAANTFVCSLQVCNETGSITATFAQACSSASGHRSAVLCATATWTHHAQNLCPADADQLLDKTSLDAVAALERVTISEPAQSAQRAMRRACVQQLTHTVNQKLLAPDIVEGDLSTLWNSQCHTASVMTDISGSKDAPVSAASHDLDDDGDQIVVVLEALTTLPQTPWTPVEELQLLEERRCRLQDACSALALQLKQLS